MEREHNYPTGLSLTPIDPALPNIAIPHTESTFVRTTRIIPIKLKQSLSFHNMIIPDETLSVSFLFMILNENGIEQTGLLATIMDFINTTDRSSLLAFFQCEDKEEVYRFTKILKERFNMIKILAACGAGVNSSHQIKSALETELSKRGYQVSCDAVMIKDINQEMLSHYDIFAQIAKTDLGFPITIPVVDAGAILYRIPAMAEPVYQQMESIIHSLNK